MAETVIGMTSLNRRLNALAAPSTGKAMILRAASYTRGRMILNMRASGARKTGSTARSIQVANVTETTAELRGSKVLSFIDRGTGIYGPSHHPIVPVSKKALRFAVGSFGKGGSLRLSGQPRKGKAGAAAAWITVRSVRGMKARPFIATSVREAGQAMHIELGVVIDETWNKV